MSQYVVTLSPAGSEVTLLLQGPGIQEGGREYVFANTARCNAFIEAVNFAYQQGLRDARRRPDGSGDRLLVVTGRNPDDLCLRPETWWERSRRRIGTALR